MRPAAIAWKPSGTEVPRRRLMAFPRRRRGARTSHPRVCRPGGDAAAAGDPAPAARGHHAAAPQGEDGPTAGEC